MPATRKVFAFLGLVVLLCAALFAAPGLLAAKNKDKKQKTDAAAASAMAEDKMIVHALNRFTFGPRPGDVERVKAMGLDKWFDEQLHPEKINDAGMEARLAPFRTLRMSTKEMVENFPPPQLVKAVENGRAGLPRDPAKRAIYEAQIGRREERKDRKQTAGDAGAGSSSNAGPSANTNKDADSAASSTPNADQPADSSQLTPEQRKARQKQQEDAMYADLGTAAAPAKTSASGDEMMMADARPAMNKPSRANAQPASATTNNDEARRDPRFDNLLDLAPDDRYKAIMKMTAADRLDMADSFRGGRALKLVDGMKPEQQETVEAIINPGIVVGGELSSAKLLRAIYSDRQLEEVMTDFWYNHFNVFIGKGPDRYMITAYERDTIRPHALGKFKDLLVATAKSPAMLFYLDNWQSVGPSSELAIYGPGGMRRVRGPYARFPRPQPRPQNNKNRRSGLNENYAREIMELHTLGVDGGYNQKDVTELAKVLTGWTIERPQQGGGFKFNEKAHEPGTKVVLGHKIKEHGEDEGMKMLDVLAHHPSTAKFISRKLAMRFVSDNPPQSLVDRMAETFEKKDGDIREVLRTLFTSPEFWAADSYRAKVKTPLEFVASSARASGVDVQNALPMVQFLNRMGMQLYGMQPPTGYSMKADAWVNSSALLNRMNFALQLGSGKLPGTQLDSQALLHGSQPQDSDQALSVLEKDLLNGDVSQQTHAVLMKQLSDPKVTQRKLDDNGRPPNVGAIAGLIMGSPEFQRR